MTSSAVPSSTSEDTDSEHRRRCSDHLRVSSSRWDKVSQTVVAVFESFRITIALILVAFFYALLGDSHDDTKASVRRQRRQCLDPELDTGQSSLHPASNSSLPLLDPSAPSFSSTRLSTWCSTCWRKVPGSVRLALYTLSPHLLTALWIWIIVQTRVRSRQDSNLCAARQNDHGFAGNSDFYGLGVRLGLYLQWFAATFAIYFMPSARNYIASSYLLCQLGMMVAMCLLVLSGSCTFTTEVSIILQVLWAGSAIVLTPHQNQRTVYSSTSPYLGLEIVSTTMAFLVFLIASWFHLRLSFGDANDFLGTPGGTYLLSGLIEVDLRDIDWSLHAVWSIWIAQATKDLITIYRDTPRTYLFSAIVSWTWNNSADMITGQLVGILNSASKALYVLVICTDFFIFAFTKFASPESEDADTDQYEAFQPGKPQSKYKVIFQTLLDLLIKWYHLLRHFFIITLAVWSIERTIQLNGISDVQSLDSTGQVMPLTIGVATLSSLLYIWVKDFLRRGRVTAPGPSSLVVGQPIGFPTESGRWI